VLAFGLLAFVGDAAALQLLVLDAPDSDPHVQVVQQASTWHLVGLRVAGLIWLASLVPGLPRSKQLLILRLSAITVVVAAFVWLDWMVIGSRRAGA
jgi:hypothetical protein